MQRDPGEILSFRALHRDAVDSDVEYISRIKETTPEPRQIFASTVLDAAKEVSRRWMLERPRPDVFPEGLVAEISAADGMSERQRYQRRFSIPDRADRCRVYVVRRGSG